MDRLKLLVERNVLEVEQAEHERTIAGLTRQAKENACRAAHEKVERHKLVASLGGVVVQVNRRLGEWVTPGVPVVRILRLDRLRAEGYLPAKQATPDLQGCAVRVQVETPGAPAFPVPGKIVFLTPRSTRSTAQSACGWNWKIPASACVPA